MIVLKATQEQFNALNGYSNKRRKLNFGIDSNNNRVVGVGVLTNPYYKEIHDQLNELERIEYIPKKETDEA